MAKIPYHPGAGFVVFNKDRPGKILALIKDNGKYDIPKGRRDGDEGALANARRECFEECSIFIEDDEILSIPPHKNGELTTFAAITDKAPDITPNASSGILEHAGYKWVDEEDFCENCLGYLEPAVRYFCQNIQHLI